MIEAAGKAAGGISKIQDSGFRIHKNRIQDLEFKIQDSGFRIQDSSGFTI